LVRKLPLSTFGAGSGWALNGNTVGALKTIGTIDSYDLPFITHNTEKMRLTSSGNLGIGTNDFDVDAPEKLLIDAGVTDSYNLLIAKGERNGYLQFNIQNNSSQGQASTDIVATANNGTETTNYVNLGINGGGYNSANNILSGPNNGYLFSAGQDFIIGNTAASKSLILFTGGINGSNERMRITSAGRVGIGTTTPAEVLDVTGNLKISGAFMPGGSAGTSGYVLTSGGAGSAPTWAAPGTVSGSWLQDGNSVSAMKSFGTITNYHLPFITNNTERMRITNTGNVGIGTSTPAVAIDLLNSSTGAVGNVKLHLARTGAGDIGVSFEQVGLSSYGIVYRDRNTVTGAQGRLAFVENYYPDAAGTGSEKMCLDGTGNLGIATNAPASRLDVNGSAGMGIVTTSSNLTLDETNHTVIITSGTPVITLPAASACARRIYVIVNHTAGARTISSYRNFSNAGTTTIAATSSTTIQSDGTNWYRIQ
jgi:hypothetical protein